MSFTSNRPSSLSRRTFLQTAALSVAATSLDAAAAPLPNKQHAPQAAHGGGNSASPVTLVNILQGTDSTPAFSRGNTLPIAAHPFGMAHWTLQSNANSPWMFAPSQRRIQGFRCTHQLSPWLGDYGHAVFLPFCGEIDPDPSSRASSYRPEDSTLSPHVLRMRLMRYSIDAELLPTERCSLITARYTKPQVPGFLFDVPGEDSPTVHENHAQRTISFTSTANSGGVPQDFATYYVLQFSELWAGYEVKALKGHHVGLLRFADKVREVQVRVGTSFISFEQAERNLKLELGKAMPDEVRTKSEAVWNGYLRRIEIDGATDVQQRTFYSCLYRTLLFPRVWHEPDAHGAMQHRSPFNGQIIPGVMYADHGYWDVYRAWYPMMTILFPERLTDVLQAWVNAYKEGGWLPQFPCPGYRACMTGSLIDSLFGEAAVKGIRGFDMAAAYEGLKKHATQFGNPDRGYGRRGLPEYLKYGYCPAGMVDQSAAETVDAAYGDYCIAQVAKALGHMDDYDMFLKRSENWRNLFDPQTGFIRGREADGTWVEPFDPTTWGDPYVEGAAWQHRWDVPHNMPALIEGLGGKEKTAAALEQMLTVAPDFNTGVYGSEIHEMSEMAAINFGQYSHNNQPVHHVLAIFAAAGRRDRGSHYVRRVLDETYTPDAFCGDEDTGSMAAWYVLGALGILVLCPAKPEYTLSLPLFPGARIHLPDGKTLQLRVMGNTDGKSSLNGTPLQDSVIRHEQLVAGGELVFD